MGLVRDLWRVTCSTVRSWGPRLKACGVWLSRGLSWLANLGYRHSDGSYAVQVRSPFLERWIFRRKKTSTRQAPLHAEDSSYEPPEHLQTVYPYILTERREWSAICLKQWEKAALQLQDTYGCAMVHTIYCVDGIPVHFVFPWKLLPHLHLSYVPKHGLYELENEDWKPEWLPPAAPLILNFHRGSYTVGDARDGWSLQWVADLVGKQRDRTLVFCSVDYALAPEAVHPAPLREAQVVVDYFTTYRANIHVLGACAGATVAGACAQRADSALLLHPFSRTPFDAWDWRLYTNQATPIDLSISTQDTQLQIDRKLDKGSAFLRPRTEWSVPTDTIVVTPRTQDLPSSLLSVHHLRGRRFQSIDQLRNEKYLCRKILHEWAEHVFAQSELVLPTGHEKATFPHLRRRKASK